MLQKLLGCVSRVSPGHCRAWICMQNLLYYYCPQNVKIPGCIPGVFQKFCFATIVNSSPHMESNHHRKPILQPSRQKTVLQLNVELSFRRLGDEKENETYPRTEHVSRVEVQTLITGSWFCRDFVAGWFACNPWESHILVQFLNRLGETFYTSCTTHLVQNPRFRVGLSRKTSRISQRYISVPVLTRDNRGHLTLMQM